MSKKNQTTESKSTENKSTENSYKLNTSAVDRLVNAKNKTYPKTNVDPGKQYRSKGFIDKIPEPIKALFIKFWFNAAVFFYIYMGLGMQIKGLDMIVVLGVVLGIVNDVLVNNAFHFFAVTKGSNDKWMMFPQRKFWTYFTNIIYSLIVLICVILVYGLIDMIIFGPGNTTNTIGSEPVLFGIIYVAIDMLFIKMKHLTISIITDAKEKAKTK